MNKQAWSRKIRSATKDAGTYKPYFDEVITTLAGILAKRDLAEEQLNRVGGELTPDGLHRNPLVVIWNDLNKSALAYWKELGLTPAGLKKLNEDTFETQKKQANSLMGLIQKSKEESK